MDPTTLRRVTPDDLPALQPLFADYLRFYGKPVDEARIARFLGDRLRLGQSVVFLAWRGDEALGFVQLYPSWASLAQAPAWILNDLFVAPSARGAGVARRLMEAARGLARETGAAEIFLQTARDNRTAQRLYERLGYLRDDHFLVYTLDPRDG